MTLLAGCLLYVGLMAAAVAFLRFVHFCDDDMRMIHHHATEGHEEDLKELAVK